MGKVSSGWDCVRFTWLEQVSKFAEVRQSFRLYWKQEGEGVEGQTESVLHLNQTHPLCSSAGLYKLGLDQMSPV